MVRDMVRDTLLPCRQQDGCFSAMRQPRLPPFVSSLRFPSQPWIWDTDPISPSDCGHIGRERVNGGNEEQAGTGPLAGARGGDRFASALISLALDVRGHEILPVGGHRKSPWAAANSPHGRPGISPPVLS